MGIIYKFTNKINRKSYIGQTINPDQRYRAHMSAVHNSNSSEYNSVLSQAMRKYGPENFDYEVLVENIDDIGLLNQLEMYYISYYNSYKNGYNCDLGDRNASRPQSKEAKDKLTWYQAALTEEEVIELRLAYADNESPKRIYEEKYKDRLSYASFMNIWSGRRYGRVRPDLLKKGRHTKLNEDQVREIRYLREKDSKKYTYNALSQMFDISESTIADICRYRTWRNVSPKEEPVSTILESEE